MTVRPYTEMPTPLIQRKQAVLSELKGYCDDLCDYHLTDHKLLDMLRSGVIICAAPRNKN